eukprot:CAMPEP_0185253790 /NCGR_PEP_ID=MMETSP1359-20130426/2389_1 /TAXON_ID=552665 /ORGANISM="Bigelowiella longifila, Strain CCMP242" /LENGTH=196 /DNA_ID=CAMNT_0027836217 /DNA_START=17 /DNA_END=607 /DNA_ORIENTATION=-
MPDENQAYGLNENEGENVAFLEPDDRKGEVIGNDRAPEAKGRRKAKRGRIFTFLHWLGIIFTLGYMGYAAGMLFGFAHKDKNAIRECITYTFMVLFSLLLLLAEFRVEYVVNGFRFLSTPFGLAMYYTFLGIFALMDDRGWWKWVLFSPMAFMGVAYIICPSCSHDTMSMHDPITNSSSDTKTSAAASSSVDDKMA